MVLEVTAYQAADGTIFNNKLEALQHDAVEALKKLNCFNHASALAVVSEAEHIAPLLQPILEELQNKRQVADMPTRYEHLIDAPQQESI